MKTKLFSLIIVATAAFSSLTSCQNQKTVNTQTEKITPKYENDVYGIYRGTIPCADCEGIKTTIHLETDNTFTTTSEYLGRNVDPFQTSGTFNWDQSGTKIILDDSKSKSYFLVGEDTLTQLDQSGNRIEGDFAQLFIFTRENYDIVDKQWTLFELMGKPVDPNTTMNKQAFITFDDASNRYTATAGCNTLSGTFVTEAFNKLKLSAGISTMMACPDMTLEDEFTNILQHADSFIIKGDELLLVKGRMAPLARFKTPLRRR